MFNGVEHSLELEHELSCLDQGRQEYIKRIVAFKQKKREHLADYGKRLIAKTVVPTAKLITEFLAEAVKGAGRRATCVPYLQATDPEVLAFITVRIVMTGISTQCTLTGLGRQIGTAIEQELKLSHFAKSVPALYRKVEQNLENNPKAGSPSTRGRVMEHTMRKFNVEWNPWPADTHVHVGVKLVELFQESCGMIEINKTRPHAGHKTTLRVMATPALLEWITKFNGQSELMHPKFQPMLCPPKPWSTPFDGGYLSDQIRRPLVKSRVESYLKSLAEAPMVEVYAAANALQQTPWRINGPMLELLKEVYESGTNVKGMPDQATCIARPRKEPKFTEETKEAWHTWKIEAATVFRTGVRSTSQRTQAWRILHLAEKFKDRECLWFPVCLDFRGRMYYTPQFLNPQGSDLSKSLLYFAEGKPLGERGVFWLAVHVANTFGYDKVTLEARAKWTREQSERIFQMVQQPLDDLWWTEADKPFQFLAACVEWAGQMTDGGERYVCHLPITVDGSCNGLQHFSSMLRDEVCGAHVNLVPRDTPGDIYAEVATKVVAALRTLLSDNGCFPHPDKKTGEVPKGAMQVSTLAKLWLDYGITRKLCKRPVMVLPYGGTRTACINYIEEYVTTTGRHPFDRKLGRAISFLASVMWVAMSEVVVGPRQAMDWLRQVAKAASNKDDALCWTTPTGFKVRQKYLATKMRQVKTRVGEQTVKLTMMTELPTVDRRKQAQALPPNFVHSLDASALCLTVNSMVSQGCTSFVAIHDSYGTHAGEMDDLSDRLREVFYQMYSNTDVLAVFAEEMKQTPECKEIPPMPPRGKLDLAGVLDSEFFFA